MQPFMALRSRLCILIASAVSFMMLVTMLADAYRRLLQPVHYKQGKTPVSSTDNSSAKPAVHCQWSAQRQAAVSRRRSLMATMQSGILTSQRYGLNHPFQKGACICTLMLLRLPACQQLYVCLSALLLQAQMLLDCKETILVC